MKLLGHSESAPASVNRYLLPHEERVVTVRRHPAVLLWPAAELIAGLVVAGVVTNIIARGNSLAIDLVWYAWLIILARFTWKLVDWAVEYLVITKTRLLFATGIITRKVNMMPLAKVTDMSFQRSLSGRLLGYGEFIFESAGQDQALRKIHYIPYPESLYLEVMAMIFPQEDKSGD